MSEDHKISKPDDKILKIPNNKGGRAGWYSPNTFKLRYVNDNAKNYWDFEENGKNLLLSVNKKELSELKKGILGILKGCGDYSIGPDTKERNNKNIRLWLWWYVR